MGNKVIELKNVSFRYAGNKENAIKNISLDIREGEYIVLAGPSGCGKTTLARIMVGLIPHFYSGDLKGEVLINGVDVRKTTIREITKIIGYVFQNPEDQILMTEVLRDISFRLEYQGLPREYIINVVHEVAKKLRIQHLLYRNVNTLSGGELQKVAIAGVLVSRPKVIILDEPTAYLSPKSTIELMSFLDELKENFGVTIVIIDHRLDLVVKRNSRIIVMYDGRIVLDNYADKVLEQPLDKLYGLNIPTLTRLAQYLSKNYGINISTYLPEVSKFIDTLAKVLS